MADFGKQSEKMVEVSGQYSVTENFISPFCTCTRKGCKHETSSVAKKFGIKIKVVIAGDDYIKLMRNPKHGYGKNINPCIDCRIFIFKKAKEYMEKIGASFLSCEAI